MARSSELVIFLKHLEKKSKYLEFDFSKVILTFEFLDETNFTFQHVLIKYDSLKLDFDQKSKFDFSVCK